MSASARQLLSDPSFRKGAREMAPVSLGLAAWGLVTGVAMVKSGLSVPLALLMSFTVFAGSSQLAALPLIAVGAPMWVVWATALCVNLRFVIFSAQWRPYLMRFPRLQRMALGYFAADLNYVMFMRRFPDPQETHGAMPYYAGGVAVNWAAWQASSVLGIVLAEAIPTQWGLGFAGTLALLGLIYSLLSDRITSLAALVAGAAAVAAFALPLKLNIVVAIAAAVCLGLMLDGTGGDAARRLNQVFRRGAGKGSDTQRRASAKLATPGGHA
jgi:predicted branched-subunit amino acid permease